MNVAVAVAISEPFSVPLAAMVVAVAMTMNV